MNYCDYLADRIGGRWTYIRHMRQWISDDDRMVYKTAPRLDDNDNEIKGSQEVIVTGPEGSPDRPLAVEWSRKRFSNKTKPENIDLKVALDFAICSHFYDKGENDKLSELIRWHYERIVEARKMIDESLVPSITEDLFKRAITMTEETIAILEKHKNGLGDI